MLYCIFQFHHLSLEDLNDVVEIYDGNSPISPLVGRYSGNSLPDVPLSSSNLLLVVFLSDQEIQNSGFNVSWEPGKSLKTVYFQRSMLTSHFQSTKFVNTTMRQCSPHLIVIEIQYESMTIVLMINLCIILYMKFNVKIPIS